MSCSEYELGSDVPNGRRSHTVARLQMMDGCPRPVRPSCLSHGHDDDDPDAESRGTPHEYG